MRETNWQKAVELAEHYKAIGETKIYLSSDAEKPWEFATSAREGCLNRIAGSVSASITAEHPSGLTFSWEVNYELDDANGSSTYRVNHEELLLAISSMPTKSRGMLFDLLTKFAERVHAKGSEFQLYANRQFESSASVLEFIRSHSDAASA